VPPNLTPDPETGIGTWSADDIKRALRTGAGSGHGKSHHLQAAEADAAAMAVAGLDLLDESEQLDQIREAAGEHFTNMKEIPRAIGKLETEMKEAARAMQFERAAEIRDRIKRLKVLSLGL
jgi:excinuclease UvrABC helicase subunit UvrB